MSAFDLDKFMDQPADTGSTSFEPIPAGEYTAIIDDAVLRAVTTKNGEGVVLDVSFLLQDEAIKAKLGREKLSIKTGFFLDTTPSGGFDMSKGKNIRLNQLREAVGQNKPGWKVPQLKGAGPLKVVVTLRPDKNSSDVIYNDVKSFGKMK